MNQEEVRKRKDWVKNAAIVFLTIMLVLTFFSNTIMNYSLPEVATQYVESGTITAKVRGTGNVEAADPYNIVAKESRVISSVAVKQGDEVEKDQVIYYLEDAESEELTQAQKDLEELKLTYMKGLFGNNVSSDIISKVASGRTDGFSTLQTKVADMQNRMDAAQARVKECQEALEKLTLQSTINTNDATINTIPEENEKAQATTELSDAQTAEAKAEAEFNRDKSERVAELTSRIEEKQKQIDDLKTLISGAESIANSNSTSSGGGDKDTVSSNSIQAMRERERTAKDELDKKLTALNGIFGTNFTADEAYSWSNSVDWDSLGDEQQKEKRQIALQDFRMAYADYKIASDLLNNAVGTLTGYSSNQEQLNNLNQELQELQARLNRVNAITYSPGDSVKDAQAKLNQADKNLSDKTNANKQASVAYQNQIANAEAALKNAQAVYDLLKEEQDEMNADINAELDLAKVSKDIAQKEEEIAKLMEKSMGAAITAPVAGTVSSLAYVAGETTKPEETAAVLQVEGKGYTLKVSVTNEQARKVQVGDTAELQNAWYYDDAQVILTGIKPDPDNPGQNKLLEFNVTGSSIQAGQALSISVGQRSSEYEFVVPNSAVREDNNGKFILIVESKSGPLSNRYIATRVDVEVLASDDNYTAISAGLYGYEYVITTSTKPVEAGKQVRLNESQ